MRFFFLLVYMYMYNIADNYNDKSSQVSTIDSNYRFAYEK